MQAAGEFVGQDFVDDAMSLHAALALEGLRHDLDGEMRLALLSDAAGMVHVPDMAMRVVDYVERNGRKRFVQLGPYAVLNSSCGLIHD